MCMYVCSCRCTHMCVLEHSCMHDYYLWKLGSNIVCFSESLSYFVETGFLMNLELINLSRLVDESTPGSISFCHLRTFPSTGY